MSCVEVNCGGAIGGSGEGGGRARRRAAGEGLNSGFEFGGGEAGDEWVGSFACE